MAAFKTEGFVHEINKELFPGAIPQTLQDFKQTIHDEQAKHKKLHPNERTPLRIGAMCLQNMIKKKIAALPPTQAVATRLNYFNSKDFLDNFCEKIELLTKYGKKNNLDGSYTNFFNVLFNTKFKGKYRASSLSLDKNIKQCEAVLGKSKPVKVGLQYDDPCYICGRDITKGEGINKMECEHILAITTALTNWWLVRKDNKRDNTAALYHEYKWSHKCCNQKKGNYDLIMYTPNNRNDYGVNDTLVRELLKDIQTAKNYFDCEAIAIKGQFDVEVQVKSINALLQPIVKELNSIHAEFDNHDEYLLLTKFKLVSALTDPTLDALITGSGTGVLSEPQKKRKKQLAQKAKEAKEEAEAKLKKSVATANNISARRNRSKTRDLLRVGGGAAVTMDIDSPDPMDSSPTHPHTPYKNKKRPSDRSHSSPSLKQQRRRLNNTRSPNLTMRSKLGFDSDEDAVANEDDVANVILFDDARYAPSVEDLNTEFEEIFGPKHTYFNDDRTTTTHWRPEHTPDNISVRHDTRKDMTSLTDQQRLQLKTGNSSIYSGRTPVGRGANKKKRRRSKKATRKMNMKGKRAVKKPTRKKRNSKKV
jgi:hypothetical protein